MNKDDKTIKNMGFLYREYTKEEILNAKKIEMHGSDRTAVTQTTEKHYVYFTENIHNVAIIFYKYVEERNKKGQLVIFGYGGESK